MLYKGLGNSDDHRFAVLQQGEETLSQGVKFFAVRDVAPVLAGELQSRVILRACPDSLEGSAEESG